MEPGLIAESITIVGSLRGVFKKGAAMAEKRKLKQ